MSEDKIFNMTIDILDTRDKIGLENIITFTQGDEQTAIINIDVVANKDPVDLSGSALSLSIRKPSTYLTNVNCEIVDSAKGKAKAILSKSSLDSYGLTQIQLVIEKKGKKTVSSIYYIKVRENLIGDIDLVLSDDFPVLKQLIEENREMQNKIQELKENVKTLEIDAITLSNTLDDNEKQRKSKESERLIKDKERNQKDIDYSNSEQNRANNENTRQSNEITRIENESLRQNQEKNRVNNENIRKEQMKTVQGWIDNPMQFKGDKGEPGSIANLGDYIINDLVTGGIDKALSAEQGKTLNNSIKKYKENLLLCINQISLMTNEFAKTKGGENYKQIQQEIERYIDKLRNDS